jgi:cell division transport system permease protein
MSWHSLEFFFLETGRNLYRQRLMSGAAVAVMAVALAVLGAGGLLLANINFWTEGVLSELEVTAYLRMDVSTDDARTIVSRVRNWPETAEARFIPRSQAFQEMKRSLRDPALDTISNPLPDAIRLRATRAELIPELSRRLQNLPAVQQVIDARATVTRLLSAARVIRTASLALGILLALAAFLLIYNAVRLTMFARRSEISIMQLVGATRTFVAAPFVMEGCALGVIGAALAAAFIVVSYSYVLGGVRHLSLLISLAPMAVAVRAALLLLAAGAVLGTLSSIFALGRFLRHDAREGTAA